jgi:hypothetical protein
MESALGNGGGHELPPLRIFWHRMYTGRVDYLHRLVEERIQKAQEEGVFDNLPGTGKPLHLDDDSSVPEDLRLTYKILKNSNCLPVEIELRKQILSLRQLLSAAIEVEPQRELRRELNRLTLTLNLRRRGAASLDLPQW